jgi:RHS repeat-associated protein
VADALGHETTYIFDRLGFTSRVVHPDGSSDRYVRDSTHNVMEHHKPDGSIVRQQFDQAGRLTGQTSPSGARTRQHYDPQGRLILTEDALGKVWRREYNAQGQVVQSVDPLGHKTLYEYDAKGQLSAIIDAKGGRKTYTYNGQGQLLSHTDCSGKTTAMAYSPDGRLQSKTDAAGGQTRYEYSRGQLSAVIHADGSRIEFERDAEGRLLKQTVPGSHSTQFRYGPAGQLIEQRNANGHVVSYQCDKSGRLKTLVNENQARYSFEYDTAGRLTQEIDFDGQETRYVYNQGQLQATITAGLMTTYEYDADGRMTQRSASEIDHKGQPQLTSSFSEHYQYDALGRMTWAKNAQSRIQFQYDEVGNLTQELCHYDFLKNGLSTVWHHRYDELGNRISTTRPDGEKLHWLTYGSGHIHGLVLERPASRPGQPGGAALPERIELLGYERDDLHRAILRTQGNGLQQSLKLDAAGRLLEQNVTSVRTPAGAAHLHGNGMPGQSLIHRRYTYDPAGLLSTIDDNLRGRTEYSYDNTGRLVHAHHDMAGGNAKAGGTNALLEHLAFDPAGNLLGNSALPHDPRLKHLPKVADNRLESFFLKDATGAEQIVRYQHDARGQRTGKGVSKGEQSGFWDTEYRWDAFGRLVQVRTPTLQAHYQYDPLGRRIGKTVQVAGTARVAEEQRRAGASRAYGQTIFGWDGELLSLEFNEHLGLTHHLYEPGAFVPAVQIQKQSWKAEVAQINYVQCDHLGTPQEVFDDGGELVWSARFKAFGQVLALNPAYVSSTARSTMPEQNLRFQGQYFDHETGLHYNRHRYFDPQAGRYLSKDPVGLLGGSNKTGYPLNPTGMVDALGLQATDGRVAMRDIVSQVRNDGLGVRPGGGSLKIGSATAKIPGKKASESLVDIKAGKACGENEVGLGGFAKKYWGKLFSKGGASVEGSVISASGDLACVDPGQVITRVGTEAIANPTINSGLAETLATRGASIDAATNAMVTPAVIQTAGCSSAVFFHGSAAQLAACK